MRKACSQEPMEWFTEGSTGTSFRSCSTPYTWTRQVTPCCYNGNMLIPNANGLPIKQPPWKELTEPDAVVGFAAAVGYPVLVRPSYVLCISYARAHWTRGSRPTRAPICVPRIVCPLGLCLSPLGLCVSHAGMCCRGPRCASQRTRSRCAHADMHSRMRAPWDSCGIRISRRTAAAVHDRGGRCAHGDMNSRMRSCAYLNI